MKATPILAERSGSAIQAQPTFNCVLIYEDAAAGKCGEHFYQKLLGAIGANCASARTLWSFPALTIPEIRNMAASVAAAADLVILAVSGKKELPAEAKEWIEMWVWLIDRAHPALVPLFDSTNGESAAIGRFLRSATASKGLDCFPHVASFTALSEVTTLPDRGFLSADRGYFAGRTPLRRQIVCGQRFRGIPLPTLNE